MVEISNNDIQLMKKHLESAVEVLTSALLMIEALEKKSNKPMKPVSSLRQQMILAADRSFMPKKRAVKK